MKVYIIIVKDRQGTLFTYTKAFRTYQQALAHTITFPWDLAVEKISEHELQDYSDLA